MSTLEPPTVLTRRPPSESPELPPSPLPSPVSGASTPITPGVLSGTATPANGAPCEASECRDAQGRLKKASKKRRRGADGASGEAGGEPRWREALAEWKLLLTLENSGSVARDHLASERTFLAYARTSLAIASTGVALVQLFTLSGAATDADIVRFARPLGAVMIGFGLLTLGIGVMRYFYVQESLLHGTYPVARISTSILSFVMLALVLVVFIIVLVAK
ncbi:uncharacterized protein BXZ73DRAFT_50443 [Epithele typhae]|uniref:uncharacterized protein n=1 Tax=Epithele typhae TaxID=378194 RepID=UPI002008D154|nr:uncharacterized protein BXZ73DRAFT_50443 [Epithele typhae]KAH9924632.1 hypothetical protein BXZ73DRAFT_50443 [Epithele typhae]